MSDGTENAESGAPERPEPKAADQPVRFIPNRRIGLLMLTSFLLLCVALALGSGPNVDGRYYELVAQVLPIFWIVLAIEHRTYRLRPEWGPDRGIVALNYALLVAGEAASLIAVAADCNNNTLLFSLTGIALVQSAIGITAYALLGRIGG